MEQPNQTNNPYLDNPITSSGENTRLVMIGLSIGKTVNTELEDLFGEINLKKFIPVTLRHDGSSYILIQQDLNLGADATTLMEAEKLLALEISRLYRKLISMDSVVLGPYPKKLLEYLKNYIS